MIHTDIQVNGKKTGRIDVTVQLSTSEVISTVKRGSTWNICQVNWFIRCDDCPAQCSGTIKPWKIKGFPPLKLLCDSYNKLTRNLTHTSATNLGTFDWGVLQMGPCGLGERCVCCVACKHLLVEKQECFYFKVLIIKTWNLMVLENSYVKI